VALRPRLSPGVPFVDGVGLRYSVVQSSSSLGRRTSASRSAVRYGRVIPELEQARIDRPHLLEHVEPDMGPAPLLTSDQLKGFAPRFRTAGLPPRWPGSATHTSRTIQPAFRRSRSTSTRWSKARCAPGPLLLLPGT
jgi:hypothetical protein